MTVVVHPMNWMRESDIDDVEPVSEKDAPVLNALRDVLVRYNSLDRFGVQLLHRHFDIGEHESMVEYIDLQNRTLTLRAEPSREPHNSIMTAWRFSGENNGLMPMMSCRWECPWGPGSQHQGTRHSGQQE